MQSITAIPKLQFFSLVLPNKALQLTGRRFGACPGAQPPAAGGAQTWPERRRPRPPVVPWYTHGRPAAERRSVRRRLSGRRVKNQELFPRNRLLSTIALRLARAVPRYS